MKKYLLEITREERQERPSEEVVRSDSEALNAGNVAAVTQDIAKDTYVNFDTNDLSLELSRLLAIQEFNPAKLQAGNGFRIIAYLHSNKYTNATELRSEDGVDVDDQPYTTYADGQVQVLSNAASQTSIFAGANAYSDATTFIATLDESDGYIFIDEFKGETKVIKGRPPLWTNSPDGEYNLEVGQKNLLGRTDTDRY